MRAGQQRRVRETSVRGGGPPGRETRDRLRLSVPVTTLGFMTAIEHRLAAAKPTASGPVLDSASTTRCRRRIHLDHDPTAVEGPRALPDPALEQRRADAADHRRRIGELLADANGSDWHEVPASLSGSERVAATAAAVAGGAMLIWGSVLPLDARAGRRGGAELLVRVPGGGYVPVIVVRHRITDPGTGALTAPLLEPWLSRAVADPERKVRSQPRDLLRLVPLHRLPPAPRAA